MRSSKQNIHLLDSLVPMTDPCSQLFSRNADVRCSSQVTVYICVAQKSIQQNVYEVPLPPPSMYRIPRYIDSYVGSAFISLTTAEAVCRPAINHVSHAKDRGSSKYCAKSAARGVRSVTKAISHDEEWQGAPPACDNKTSGSMLVPHTRFDQLTQPFTLRYLVRPCGGCL